MGISKFEDLRVWQEAKLLVDDIGGLITRDLMQRDRALRDQLNAATLSTMSNIAEGFLRGRRKEFVQFLRIAAGSKSLSGILCVGHNMRSVHAPETESPSD